MEATKLCSACGAHKAVGEFYPAKGYRGGRKPQCKPCYSDMEARYYNPHQKRVGHLRRKYGLTPEQYEAMSGRQGHACAICRRPETAVSRNGKPLGLAVDHDHATGRVRGLVCRRHNQAIGLFGDDPELLRAAADYLGAW